MECVMETSRDDRVPFNPNCYYPKMQDLSFLREKPHLEEPYHDRQPQARGILYHTDPLLLCLALS